MTASTTDARDAAPPARPAMLLSGVDTVCELLVARRELDERDGLDTATFVSGYPGSPLGGFDLALEGLGARLGDSRIVHRPGLNEELAAAAVWGSQMGAAVPYEGVDGVVGAWYGKGPGLDRSGDVLKHANLMGSGPGGGAVLFVGDDPSAKSSTLPYDTNLALADAERARAGAGRPAGPVRSRRRGVPAEPVLRFVGRRADRDRGRRRRRHGRHEHRPLPHGRPRGRDRRAALAPRAGGPDPGRRPRGAVARPSHPGGPGVGHGAGPRPRRRRRRAAPGSASSAPARRSGTCSARSRRAASAPSIWRGRASASSSWR